MKKLGLLPKLVIGIALGIVIGAVSNSVGTEVPVRLLATYNGIFSQFLNFIIPLIIIGFIVPGIADLGTGAGKTLASTAGIAYVSTVCAGTLAFLTATFVFPMILTDGSAFANVFDNPEHTTLPGYFTVEMPAIMGVMSALILAFVMGLGIAVVKGEGLKKVFDEFQSIISKVISTIIIPLLPIHVMGIFCNLTYAGTVVTIMSTFAKVFVIVIILHCVMIVLQYLIGGALSGKNPFVCIKNMLPAYATAIGTQSSAATIPVTNAQTKLNGVSAEIADFVVPLCATIHLSGSTITLTCCSMAIMMMSGMTCGFGTMFPFILMLGVTMVAAPGVPGGAVMAALGLLESMLGFSEVQLSLMIALYLAQDSFGTACNVTGDGAIALIVDALFGKKQKA
ncbi:MAG: dicarboxylate/amino acid:cation symporter [Oscillospiraceae bacterium]|nr:dicarboxylate/amino acid:cation symporter [Oscillospiraceae bacterium]